MRFVRYICILISFVLIFTLSSCNESEIPEVKISSVELSVDKTVVTANKVEAVKLSAVVKDDNGNVIENPEVYYYEGKTLLSYPEFRTDVEGMHYLYARCGEVKSKQIRIIATNRNVRSIDLFTDKYNLISDGNDSTTLTASVFDNQDNFVPDAKVSYFVDDVLLESTTYNTTVKGVHLLKAKVGSTESNIIAISANEKLEYRIEISADKVIVDNDGLDKATFTVDVYDENNNKIEKAKYELYNGTKKLSRNSISSTKEGVHSIYAVYNGHVSNTLKITIRDPNPPTYRGPESDMPVIVIDTNGQTITADERVSATMYVYNNNVNKPGDTPELVTPIGIKLRGQSSLTFPKKQYGIETWDEQGNDRSVSILGLPKESDWVLNGSYADKSLLRNYVAFEFFRAATPYAPRTRLCEVYINDSNNIDNPYNYMGIYTLIEKIKIDKNRVNIDKLGPEDNYGENLTGGYIVAQDKVKEGEPHIKTSHGANFTYVSPDYEKMTDQQRDYIKDYILAFHDALFGKYYMDFDVGYRAYLDVDSYITTLCITEFLKAADGMDLSTYYYKPRGEKLHSGPAWDYDLSQGNTDFRTCTDPTGWYCVSLDEFPRRMMSDESFRSQFREKWKELRKTVLTDENIDKIIDIGLETIKNAKNRSFERWPGQWNGDFVWPNPSGDAYTYTYEEELNRMRNFLHARAKWIDDNINKYIDLKPVHYDWINEFTFERMNPIRTPRPRGQQGRR